MNKSEITVGMINNMQHCIGFDENTITGTKHRVMHAYRNYYYTYSNDNCRNALIELELADRADSETEQGLTYFSLTTKGLKFLAELCGFEKIIDID